MREKLQLIYISKEKLQKLEGNPRKQVDENGTEKLRTLIRKHGFQNPLQVFKEGEKYTIICGNHRFDAGILEGMTEFPCIEYQGTRDEAIARAISDNKSSEWTTWAEEELKKVMDDLHSKDFDMNMTGFEFDEINEIIEVKDDQDDDVPEIEENRTPVVQKGDIWTLGKHRLVCGDATSAEDFNKLMNGQKADLCFTSPPYNVATNNNMDGSNKPRYVNSKDNLSSEDYRQLLIQSTRLAISNAKDVFINLQFLSNNKRDLILYMAELVESFKDLFFWKKRQVAPAMARNIANSQTETIIFFGEDNEADKTEWVTSIALLGANQTRAWGNKYFRGTFSNFIETNNAGGENKNADIHKATFPVELPLRFIVGGYKKGSVVIDMFGGTGTTLIACEKSERTCYTLELEPLYCDVILRRWADYTGKDPVRHDGVKLSEISNNGNE